jgi:hypothetical protein
MKLGLLPTGILRSQVDFAEIVRFAVDSGYQAIDVMVDRPDAKRGLVVAQKYLSQFVVQ